MKDNKELYNSIVYLFDRYWDEDLTEDDEDKLNQKAANLISEFGWERVFSVAQDYLHNECVTPEQVVNFASNYWNYGWYDFSIPNPYDFIGYFYYVINFETEKYDCMDILDSLATTILPKAGYSNANLVLNTQYMPENDENIIAVVNKYKMHKQ